MTKYLDKSFTVAPGKSDAYRDNYDRAFGKRDAATPLEAAVEAVAYRVVPHRLVIIESPYAGDLDRNLAYVREAMRDCLLRGEAPYASHALYTQPGVLRDDDRDERRLGIEAGLLWGRVTHADIVVYADYGISPGMQLGIDRAKLESRAVEIRYLYPFPSEQPQP